MKTYLFLVLMLAAWLNEHHMEPFIIVWVIIFWAGIGWLVSCIVGPRV